MKNLKQEAAQEKVNKLLGQKFPGYFIEANNASDEELIQMIANCAKTDALAGGHTKGRMNEIRCEEFTLIAVSRGLEVPERTELYKFGVFNGKGAW